MSGRTPTTTGTHRAAWLAVLGILVTVLLISLPLFVFPSTLRVGEVRSQGPVDAVVVLGGGLGERLDVALDVVAELPEPPPVLVLSVPYGPPLIGCSTVPQLPRVAVECFEPDPYTTSGEAAWIAATMAERGWQRVVVVTSDFHVTRSRRLLEQCVEVVATGTEVLFVAAPTDQLSLHGMYAVVTEWPSYLATGWDHQPVCRAD